MFRSNETRSFRFFRIDVPSREYGINVHAAAHIMPVKVQDAESCFLSDEEARQSIAPNADFGLTTGCMQESSPYEA